MYLSPGRGVRGARTSTTAQGCLRNAVCPARSGQVRRRGAMIQIDPGTRRSPRGARSPTASGPRTHRRDQKMISGAAAGDESGSVAAKRYAHDARGSNGRGRRPCSVTRERAAHQRPDAMTVQHAARARFRVETPVTHVATPSEQRATRARHRRCVVWNTRGSCFVFVSWAT